MRSVNKIFFENGAIHLIHKSLTFTESVNYSINSAEFERFLENIFSKISDNIFLTSNKFKQINDIDR